ncbi:hypothetical protein P280DRAFT_515686 [Massarina eburnea CBS 473.64]|uniref:NTF2-domain-containing protein n=1 Tax=Massarina eburnea CBS 473.64 TaxID=1395130 RepID=A0A6A6S946_9PLEO|nr:hypothetical protein P280DRAFT_515686 [Massarina eburnea CBS 473.64]
MATTESANGIYAQQGYDAAVNNFNAASANSVAGYGGAQQQAPGQSASSAPAESIPKDEVGWYFVEQYYTTLSKTPDKLYLFYNKRSQFVSGTEEDKVNVCVGQKAINDRIRELDFADTKVRVTNVDSQGSDANIVIQVIGEISNKGQPHKRFVQTFILAEQTNGYFVLNDIFRYLAEEPEEEEDLQQEQVAAQEPAPTTTIPEEPTQHAEVAQSEEDLTKVDQKLEETAKEEPARAASPPPAAVNGTPVPETAEVAEAEEAPAAAVSASEESKKVPEPPTEEYVPEPEKPKDPAPTPAPAAPKAAPVATPAAPPKPTAPRTWASLAASAHKVAMPAIPSSTTQQAPSQAKSTTSTSAPAPIQPSAIPAQVSAPVREASPANSQGDASGWQTAGHRKEQSRTQNAPVDADQKRAYIKNVYSQVEDGTLRNALSKFGEVEYLDISRGKNCAFVDFKTPAGFQAAVAANPHTVNGIEIKVEERRLRPQQPFYPRGGPPRGRGGMGGQPRGGYQSRGRGGPIRGGRGAPQEA